jgi:O-antigen ligase
MLTLVVIPIIDLFWTTGFRRMLRLAVLGSLPVLVVVVASVAPGVFLERSDPSNLYARIIQQRQTARIFVDHPLFGVGLMNFVEVAESNPHYAPAALLGVESESHPHNNVGAILAETGIAGAVPYIASQVLLLMAFWRLRRTSDRGAFVWKYFLYIFLSYWISGMALGAGYYGDLNMWFVFATMLLYKYGARGLTEESAHGLPIAA